MAQQVGLKATSHVVLLNLCFAPLRKGSVGMNLVQVPVFILPEFSEFDNFLPMFYFQVGTVRILLKERFTP